MTVKMRERKLAAADKHLREASRLLKEALEIDFELPRFSDRLPDRMRIAEAADAANTAVKQIEWAHR